MGLDAFFNEDPVGDEDAEQRRQMCVKFLDSCIDYMIELFDGQIEAVSSLAQVERESARDKFIEASEDEELKEKILEITQDLVSQEGPLTVYLIVNILLNVLVNTSVIKVADDADSQEEGEAAIDEAINKLFFVSGKDGKNKLEIKRHGKLEDDNLDDFLEGK